MSTASQKEPAYLTVADIQESFNKAATADRIVKARRGFGWGYAWYCAGYSKYRPGFFRRLGRTVLMYFGLAYSFKTFSVQKNRYGGDRE